jgi:hypothetical protein
MTMVMMVTAEKYNYAKGSGFGLEQKVCEGVYIR